MFRVDLEMLPGDYPRPSKCRLELWTIDTAHQIAKNAIKSGGYKDVKIYDLDRPCGDIYYIEHYYLGLNGWDIE